MPLPARLLAFALGALSLALLPRTAAADGVQVQGTATYTGGNLAGGACLYYNYTLPPGLYGTAIDLSHGTPYQCGTCLRIIGSLGTIVAMVVDNSPGMATDELNIFSDGFKQIEDPSVGVADVVFQEVDCGIPSGIILRNKPGTSRYYFSMQVLNSNELITDFEVSADQGKTWQPTELTSFNYFQKNDTSGFGVDKVTVRLACPSGLVLVVPGVPVASGTQYDLGVNC